METSSTTAAPTADWTLPGWAALLGVLLLLGWQGWLTSQLFGDQPWINLTSAEPIVSGAHPQNFYLGLKGARAILDEGRTSVLDHYFQATYPITPIFDGGRLAELFLLIGGGTNHPAAYKIGIASLCMLVPILMLIACKAFGVSRGTSLLAAALAQLVWWGPLGQNAMQCGHCELYLASLAGLAHVGCLIAFHRSSSGRAWVGLFVTAGLGWFLQPLLFPIALPILLIYYHSVGVKHEFLTWHVAFWTAELFALACNLLWLTDWIDSWWLRASLPTNVGFLEHRTFATVWNAPLWEGSTDRMLAILLMTSAVVGVIIFNQTRQRPTARLLLTGAFGSLVLALLGISWEQLSVVGTAALLAPALWFACVPAAHAWVVVGRWLWRQGGFGRWLGAGIVAGVTFCIVGFTESPRSLVERCMRVTPLSIGLGPDRQALVETLLKYTTKEARIVWEDRPPNPRASRWSALLPILTGRQFIGGLDPDGFIEHSSISLTNRSLEGRPIITWSDEELDQYCRRYNVRWLVVWSPNVIQRFEEWKNVQKVQAISDGQPGWLFEVKRTPSFALKGQAELLHADGQYITLTNVIPNDGEVVISMHYQTGMRASPGRVRIERASWGVDPIGFVRLKLSERITVVTLSWEN